MFKLKSLKLIALSLILCLSLASAASAHSGRTDADGGHNCSQKSKDKGLCTGYHYHNSGSSSKSSTSKSSTTKQSSSGTKQAASTKPAYQTSEVVLIVNGAVIDLSNKPLVKNNQTFFPVREVSKAIAAELSLNDANTELTLTRSDKSVTFKLDSKDIISHSNTTYAPIRAIIEKLGGKVTYDAKANTIKVDIQ